MINHKNLFKKILKVNNFTRMLIETRETQSPVGIRNIIFQKVLRINGEANWPVHFSSMITHAENIELGVDTAPGIMPGCYIQGGGGISVGSYTQIAANVGIISRNHEITDLRVHVKMEKPSVSIGDYCWIGMNSVILPGVKLGDFTIVGAGSVVTKSYLDGYCVLAGNPARVIKKIDPMTVVRYENMHKYIGFRKVKN
jgi:acetyltransferase-like isoleucine patch superfamily enzyme